GPVLGRTLAKLPAPRAPAAPPPPPHDLLRPARNLTTTRVQRITVDDGAVALVGTEGPPIVVSGARLRAGPLEVGPGATRPFELDLTASAAPFAREVEVSGSVAQPL